MNVQELFEEMKKSQEDHFTAFPALLLLQAKRYIYSNDDVGGYIDPDQSDLVYLVYGDDSEPFAEETSREEAEKYMEELKKESPESEYRIEEKIRSHHWETINVFFTDKGYKDHMKANGHNIGEHRTFWIHAFRNEEMECVFEVLEKISMLKKPDSHGGSENV